jgi:hypothetical protein
MERAMRIELTWPAWKAGALPLSYARIQIPLWSSQARMSRGRMGLRRGRGLGMGSFREATQAPGSSPNSVATKDRALGKVLRMAKAPPATTPEEYIAQLEEPRRSQIQALYDLVREAAPELEPWMVAGKIGFGKFEYQGKSKKCAGEWFKLAVASNKNTIMFATCAVENGQNLTQAYADKLPKADIGKSCINFKKFEDADLSVLKEIAQRTAKADFSVWMM